VQILDRGVPVARLTGLKAPDAEGDDERRRRLIEAGIIRPGTGNVLAALASHPPLEISIDLAGALDEERADRV
jgi:antitoxin (DNA-binding transcriptional repressor) of toxin-antitoxin stability system